MFVSKLGEYKGVFVCEHLHSSITLCWGGCSVGHRLIIHNRLVVEGYLWLHCRSILVCLHRKGAPDGSLLSFISWKGIFRPKRVLFSVHWKGSRGHFTRFYPLGRCCTGHFITFHPLERPFKNSLSCLFPPTSSGEAAGCMSDDAAQLLLSRLQVIPTLALFLSNGGARKYGE